jgi:putative phosphoserine phosphatase / 1-acylglycerol-3-phosphate O-acyltransferase
VIAQEEKEIKEAGDVMEKRADVAAFFDLDGTLIAGPSLERRFFRELRYRGVIGWKNYLLWLAQALRLAPRGITGILQGNKMYLRGVAVAPNESNPGEKRKCTFFAAAIERLAWHAERGDAIFIVSGTLKFLARGAARKLQMILTRRGIAAKIQVCATRLEEREGLWTGQVAGEAMFGGAKARAARRLGAQMGFDLKRSYAYGDSAQDWWLLDAVGNPWAVNPSPGLSRVAQQKNWPVVWWNEGEGLTQRGQRAQRTQRRAETMVKPGSMG